MIRDLVYNLLILAVDGLLLAYVARTAPTGRASVAGWASAAVVAAAVMFGLGLVMGVNLFHTLRLYSFAVFLHVPLLLSGASILVRSYSRSLSIVFGAAVLAIAAVGVDAFFVEPTSLEVNRVRIETSKITRPFRIAVVSDLQIDRVGDHERRALTEAMRAQPDLMLLPGDYIHVYPWSVRRRVANELRALMQELDLGAPLGVYAVRGNVEHDGWTSLFDGLPVTVMPRTETLPVDELSLTGLGFSDSFFRQIRVGKAPGFHIVFGHAPDFALGDVDADLLVAGHTHGGQVRLPLLGPLITFSRVPRSWAAGVTQLNSGATLVVSRGIGMERGYAPRLRFLCRPELVIIELVPVSSG